MKTQTQDKEKLQKALDNLKRMNSKAPFSWAPWVVIIGFGIGGAVLSLLSMFLGIYLLDETMTDSTFITFMNWFVLVMSIFNLVCGIYIKKGSRLALNLLFWALLLDVISSISIQGLGAYIALKVFVLVALQMKKAELKFEKKLERLGEAK